MLKHIHTQLKENKIGLLDLYCISFSSKSQRSKVTCFYLSSGLALLFQVPFLLGFYFWWSQQKKKFFFDNKMSSMLHLQKLFLGLLRGGIPHKCLKKRSSPLLFSNQSFQIQCRLCSSNWCVPIKLHDQIPFSLNNAPVKKKKKKKITNQVSKLHLLWPQRQLQESSLSESDETF